MPHACQAASQIDKSSTSNNIAIVCRVLSIQSKLNHHMENKLITMGCQHRQNSACRFNADYSHLCFHGGLCQPICICITKFKDRCRLATLVFQVCLAPPSEKFICKFNYPQRPLVTTNSIIPQHRAFHKTKDKEGFVATALWLLDHNRSLKNILLSTIKFFFQIRCIFSGIGHRYPGMIQET